MQQESQNNRSDRAVTLRTLLLIFTGGLVLLLLVVGMSNSFILCGSCAPLTCPGRWVKQR